MLSQMMLSLRRCSSLCSFFLLSALTSNLHSLASGIDRLFLPECEVLLHGKRVAMLTTSAHIDSTGTPSYQRFKSETQRKNKWTLSHFFAPEHGFFGEKHAQEQVYNEKDEEGVKIYSLHGTFRRPTAAMLAGIDLIVVDLQDIGSRNYTYASTLFYLMESAARYHVSVLLLDRPNPLARAQDGPAVDDVARSFLGYVNVPLCHGMSLGELARYFQEDYIKKGSLTVIPYQMELNEKIEDGTWNPLSPQIPTITSARSFAATTFLASLSWVNIGVGYTLPFQVIGAPWIDGFAFCQEMNALKLPGVYFQPFKFVPFFGLYRKQVCHGAHLILKDFSRLKPFRLQVEVLDYLARHYPSHYQEMLSKMNQDKWEYLVKVTGIANIEEILRDQKNLREQLLKKSQEGEHVKERLKKHYLY